MAYLEESLISIHHYMIPKEAYLVCHIEVDSAARHCIRRTVVEVATGQLVVVPQDTKVLLLENSRMAAGEEGVAGSHSRFEGEGDRSSAVCDDR